MRKSCHRAARGLTVSVLIAGCCLCILTACAEESAHSPVPAFETFSRDVRPILEEHCFTCHGDGLAEGQVTLDEFDADTLGNPELWERVLKNVRAGLMPPPDQDRPSDANVKTLERWIKHDIFDIDPAAPNPGQAVLRRLNRQQYRNTILDLLGHDFDVSESFPPDNTGEGFDNIGSLLTVSPLLMEKYIRAAREIVRAVVPSSHRAPAIRRFSDNQFLPDGANHISCRTPGQYSSTVRIDTPGEYVVRAEFVVYGTTFYTNKTTRVSFNVGSQQMLSQGFGWQGRNKARPALINAPLTLEAGDIDITFDVQPDTGDDPEPANVPLALEVIDVQLEGPLDEAQWETPPRYREFFPRTEPPTDQAARRQYARDVLRPFLDRAFRRPVEESTLSKLTDVAASAWESPEATFETGIQQAMIAALCSRRFLFNDARPVTPTSGERFPLVDEFTLASRLSYFLWNSMPDERLFELANNGQLRNQLDTEVRRMIDDPKSERFVESFVGQWLRTREVDTVEIDTRLVLARDHNVEDEELAYREDLNDTFLELRRKQEAEARNGDTSPTEPEKSVFEMLSTKPPKLPGINLDEPLRQAMRAETEMQFSWILHEDRSLLEFLDGDSTFLNARLAQHYGIEGVKGPTMRRVPLPKDSPRGGVLGHAGLLMITSQSTRTSAVKRGVFVLDNLLGTPAPPAPPNIPALEDAGDPESKGDLSLREMLEWHRRNPNCASCHRRMDPIGLALEKFNALGLRRDKELGRDIDVMSELPTGEQLGGLDDLRKVLVNQRRPQYYRCLTEKLMIYALGRGLDYRDTHSVDLIVDRLESDSGRCSSLLTGVIRSAAFQRMRPADRTGR